MIWSRFAPTLKRTNQRQHKRIALHIIQNVETSLVNNPEMGRPGRVPGTCELVMPKTPFVVPYRLVGKTIQILRVFHGARRWPDTL
jgi:toxin ParE1/3/4